MRILIPLFFWVLSVGLAAQESSAPMPPELISLTALNESLSSREARLSMLQERLRTADNEVQRQELTAEIARVSAELSELRMQFRGIALATDLSAFEETPREEFNLQKEVEQLIQPLLAELRAATAESREMEELKRQLAFQESRVETATRALNNLNRLLDAGPDAELAARLRELRSTWQGRLRDAENQRTVLRQQIAQREAARLSLLERTKGAAGGFVRTRGRNLLLGLLAFLGVFFGMQAALTRLSNLPLFRGRAFTPRLLHLLWNIASVVVAVVAVMIVFNLAGDWFLLSLVLVFLIGVGWAGIKTLPQFMELIRMMLNIGAVRENERLEYLGIPWQVRSIGFQTRLVNPLLDGGDLRLPTRMLVGMHSREPGQGEGWFPTQAGDWVVLGDSGFGRVSAQTPSIVRVDRPGGAQTVIPTPDFLSLRPTNLSAGFRCDFSFGIDYRHQSQATTAIPRRMAEHLQEVLTARLGSDLRGVRVEFDQAADSSLNIAVAIDCAGGAAPHYAWIPRWAQAALVELCTREGWNIPFPQLTLHRAG